jgi:signal transduction histidine kinase
MRRLSPFWRVSLPQALVETFLISAALLTGLLLAVGHVPAQVIQQGLFLLGPICALPCALRLRMSQRRVWWRLLREGIAAVALSVGLALMAGVSTLILARALQWDKVLVDSSSGIISLTAVLTLGASGPVFLFLRAGVWLWHYWDRLRRRRLLWALTHAHLTLVVALVALMAVLGAFQVANPGSVEGRFMSDEWTAVLVARLTQTFLPFAGVMALLTVVLLAAVLPPSAIFSYFVSRRTTRRLEALATASQALRGGDYAARVSVTGEDEVAQLQSDFNAMAQELEQTLRDLEAQRDTVSRLLQSRRELVAGVSHELRTPIATVRTTLESALERWEEAEPASLQHDLKVMQSELLRLQGLIDDLFALSRVEAGGLTLDCRPTDVVPVVRRMVEAIAPLAWSTERLEVLADLPAELPLVRTDAARLEQILANLLRNGVRHTPPGGIVAVTAAAEERTVRIEVRDTGEGIPPEELPHVWERFYRGESARAEDSRGAGLGLALVKELTEAMGGSVEVESVVGRGSCFVVRLPKSDA